MKSEGSWVDRIAVLTLEVLARIVGLCPEMGRQKAGINWTYGLNRMALAAVGRLYCKGQR